MLVQPVVTYRLETVDSHMFESLQTNLRQAFRTITGQARLTEANMREGLQLVRQALLEADVSFPVVRQFMDRVTEKALGQDVLESLKAGDMLLHIVYQELIALMSPADPSLHLRDFTKIMMCGLQGSGKTTTCGKLARMLKQSGHKPMLVAADLQRPAAIHQLQVLAEQIGVAVFADTASKDPVDVCHRAVKQAQGQGCDVVIFDTAGRLHIDEELMGQLRRVDAKVEPHQCYLVVDGMTGQDAVNSAKAFNEALELDGVILTKLDGDARGGAVISVKAVTGVPIKFLGTGEHLQDLEPFRPEGMASRILGEGDLLEVIRRAQTEIDQDEMRRQEEALSRGEFTLDNFRDMLAQTTKLGPLQKVMSLLPGMGAAREMMKQMDAEQDLKRLTGIINSMTPAERRQPKQLIDQSRRRRIAAGAGVQPHEVNELVKQFEPVKEMMQKMATMGMRDRMKMMREMQQQMASGGAGGLALAKKGTGKRLTSAEKKKLKKEREKEARRKRRKGKD